jgi:ribonuclease P protein component
MALPQTLRLPRREFILTREKGQPYSQKYFSAIHYKPLTGNGQTNHYAVVISSRVHKNAVVRNHLRRTIQAELSLSKRFGFNIIIYPKVAMLKLSRAEINTGINQFLSEIYS